MSPVILSPIAGAVIGALATIWAIRHQRLGRIGRVRLIKEQIDLVATLGERFGEVRERVEGSIESELRGLYPTESSRLDRAALAVQVASGTCTLLALLATVGAESHRLKIADGGWIGALTGITAILAGELYKALRAGATRPGELSGTSVKCQPPPRGSGRGSMSTGSWKTGGRYGALNERSNVESGSRVRTHARDRRPICPEA